MKYEHVVSLLPIRTVFAVAVVLVLSHLSPALMHAQSPNFVLVFIDDMGWGDFSCFGNTEAATPNVDALAKDGIRFHQFYVNYPICSPSRVAISTGQYPQRHRITSFLNNRQDNKNRGVADWLDPTAPMLARILHDAGYATAHCGKWHMGGQRDVNDAPIISTYGFDTSLTNFEGMGAKLLPMTETPTENGEVKRGRIWENAVNLGEPVQWMLRAKITGGFADKAVEFIDAAQKKDQPFYINVWPDDVHTPLFPSLDGWDDSQRGKYLSVLEEMDAQLAPLFDRIKNDPALKNNTMILVCSDNGPEKGAGSAGPFKGGKATLFEGGIRSPLVVWAPGLITEDRRNLVNTSSVFAAMDLVPSLLKIAGVPTPSAIDFDGEELADVLLGKSSESRAKPIFFRRPPDRKEFRGMQALPDLAVRDGKWKLLCDYDGGRTQLYDMNLDLGETTNVSEQHPEETERLVQAVLQWNNSMPADAGDPRFAQSN